MKNYNMILTEAAKISALSSGKIDKYEYPTGEETLPPGQKLVIGQAKAKFTYSPLNKAFERQIKTIEDQGEKQMHEKNWLNLMHLLKEMITILKIN